MISPSDEDTEFLATLIRATYMQLYWQGFDRLVGVVDESLVERFKELRDLVNGGNNYNYSH